MSFTAKELREMMRLPNVEHLTDLGLVKSHVDRFGSGNLDRAKRRLTEILLNSPQMPIPPSSSPVTAMSQQLQQQHRKSLTIHFMKSPTRFIREFGSSGRVTGIGLARNEFVGTIPATSSVSTLLPPQDFAALQVRQIEPLEEEILETGLVIRSVGYRAERLSKDVPFDERLGLVPNQMGRVVIPVRFLFFVWFYFFFLFFSIFLLAFDSLFSVYSTF